MPARGAVQNALEAALRTVAKTPADGAVVALARQYAKSIDEYGVDDKIGGKFLDALVELGMTPRARAAITKGKSEAPPSGQLDELRARREQRAARK